MRVVCGCWSGTAGPQCWSSSSPSAPPIWLLGRVPQEYAPQEDQGSFMAMFSGAEGMGIERMKREALKLEMPAMQMVNEASPTWS